MNNRGIFTFFLTLLMTSFSLAQYTAYLHPGFDTYLHDPPNSLIHSLSMSIQVEFC